jgi:hypothetical protein
MGFIVEDSGGLTWSDYKVRADSEQGRPTRGLISGHARIRANSLPDQVNAVVLEGPIMRDQGQTFDRRPSDAHPIEAV